MLRRATVDDLDGIMAIETPTFATDAWSRGTMRSELASPHTFYLVETDGEDGEVVAYAGLLSPRHSHQADIQTIAVRDDHRRSGLGRALMEALIAEAVERHARDVFLDVRVDNERARTLYESLGFARIGTRERYYPGGIDADVMRLRLGVQHD